MINYLFAGMLLLGVVCGVFTGSITAIGDAAMTAAADGAAMCIGLVGGYALWMGLINVLKEAGAMAKFSRGLFRVIGGLFEGVEQGSQAAEYISLNLSANVLGIGNAATPFGLRAMELLQEQNPNKRVATNAMVMFLVINASSIQLLPLNVIALRSANGSAMSAAIVLPSIIATGLSTLVAILAAKVFERKF